MKSKSEILKARKSEFRERFRSLLAKTPVPEVDVPSSPQEALKMGFRIGLRQGYGAGMLDGVDLGYDVGADSAVSLVTELPEEDFSGAN